MKTIGDEIYQKHLDVLQDAEEMGGPEGEEYLKLMRDIIIDCQSRIDVFLETHR